MHIQSLKKSILFEIIDKFDSKSINNFACVNTNSSRVCKEYVHIMKICRFIFLTYDTSEELSEKQLKRCLFSEKKVIGLGENHWADAHRLLNSSLITFIWRESFSLRIECGNKRLQNSERLPGQLKYLPSRIANTAQGWDSEQIESEVKRFMECAFRVVQLVKQIINVSPEKGGFKSANLIEIIDILNPEPGGEFETSFLLPLYRTNVWQMIDGKPFVPVSLWLYRTLMKACWHRVYNGYRAEAERFHQGTWKIRNESLCENVISDCSDGKSCFLITGRNHIKDKKVREVLQKKFPCLFLIPKKEISHDYVRNNVHQVFGSEEPISDESSVRSSASKNTQFNDEVVKKSLMAQFMELNNEYNLPALAVERNPEKIDPVLLKLRKMFDSFDLSDFNKNNNHFAALVEASQYLLFFDIVTR